MRCKGTTGGRISTLMSINVGLVGYGAQFSMGKHHADHIHNTQGLELKGVFDIDPIRREAAKAEQPMATVFDKYEDMLGDDEIELVVLITPHDSHKPLSVMASKAGKHVITEKVMCLSVAEADEMIETAEKAGKMLTVYQNRRWDGDYLTVKKVMDSGVLGRVFSIESSVNGFWAPPGWRAIKAHGGGMLYDWGAHLIDQLIQLNLGTPKTVFAQMHYGGQPVDTETHATVSVNFEGGVFAQIDVGCVSHITRPRWLIRGEKGAFIMPDWENARIKYLSGEETIEEDVKVEHSQWDAFYENVSKHLNEGAELEVKPRDVRKAIAVIESAFRSAELNQSVECTL